MGLSRAVSVLCACLCLWATQAHADETADKAEAERLFKAGVSLQKAEDFDAAIAAFESSFRLFATKSALFNLANCQQAIHRYPEALATLEKLDHAFGAELEEPMRARVKIQRAELENLTALLSVEVEQPGAEVLIDGRSVGTTPLSEPVRLSLGDHEIEVKLPGYVSESRGVNLAPAETVVQGFELRPEAPPAPPPVAPAPPPPAGPAAPPALDAGPTRADGGATSHVAGWVLLGTGGALLVAGTATGLWALSLDNELSDACWEGHCPPSKRDDVKRLDGLTTTTNVLLGLGAAGAATGVVLLLLDGGREPASGPEVGLSVAPGYVGAGVRGGF